MKGIPNLYNKLETQLKNPSVMRVKSIEEIYVNRIECGIRGIQHGTKKPEDVNVHTDLKKLQSINDGLCEDLYDKYYNTIDAYRKKLEKLTK